MSERYTSRDPGSRVQFSAWRPFFATGPGWVLKSISFWHSNFPTLKNLSADNECKCQILSEVNIVALERSLEVKYSKTPVKSGVYIKVFTDFSPLLKFWRSNQFSYEDIASWSWKICWISTPYICFLYDVIACFFLGSSVVLMTITKWLLLTDAFWRKISPV